MLKQSLTRITLGIVIFILLFYIENFFIIFIQNELFEYGQLVSCCFTIGDVSSYSSMRYIWGQIVLGGIFFAINSILIFLIVPRLSDRKFRKLFVLSLLYIFLLFINYSSVHTPGFDCGFFADRAYANLCYEQLDAYLANPTMSSLLLFNAWVPTYLRLAIIYILPGIWVFVGYKIYHWGRQFKKRTK